MRFPCPPGHAGALHPLVEELKILLTPQGRLKSLDAAVKAGVQEGISELTDWGILNGQDFLQHASCLLEYWIPSENSSGTFLYEVLTMFYYIFDRPEMIDLQTSIHPSSIKRDGLPKITPISKWIIDYAKSMGEWLDKPASITAESYESFWNAAKFRMEDYLIPKPADPTGGFENFNQLFCRHLKEDYRYPNVRSISSIDDSSVVVFPADSTFDGYWDIDSNNNVAIKTLPWPISALLAGSEYADRFKGGMWCHAFLNTFDYHRQHAPVAGTIVENRVIPGLCYLEIETTDEDNGKKTLKTRRPFQDTLPDPGNNPEKNLTAPDHAGYQFIQMRGCIIIDTGAKHGLVAVLPIGMAQVSSIKLSRKCGDVVKKGEEISWFEYGGSDVVVVFEKAADPIFSAALGAHHLMGETLCELKLDWPGDEVGK